MFDSTFIIAIILAIIFVPVVIWVIGAAIIYYINKMGPSTSPQNLE